MTNKLKKSFKIASIMSYIMGVFVFAVVLGLFLEVPSIMQIFSSAYYAVMPDASSSQVISFMNTYVIYGLIFASLNYYVAGLYSMLSKVPEKVVVHKLGVLMAIELVQLLFAFVVFPPISLIAPVVAGVATIVLYNNTEKMVKIATMPTQLNLGLSPEVTKSMVEKIKELKMEKEKGVYSEEEYMLKLNKILENSLN